MRAAVYAGSFDPPTNGHMWMIKQGIRLFDSLYVAVGVNSNKKSSFSPKDRVRMLTASIEEREIKNVYVHFFENMYSVNFAHMFGAEFILRGIRSPEDYAYERTIRQINEDIRPGLVHVFLQPDRNLAEISSSFIKGLIGPEGWERVVKKMVPKTVFQFILKEYELVRWRSLCYRMEVKDESTIQNTYNMITEQYMSPGRDYHSLTHINNCLNFCRELQDKTDTDYDDNALEFALWLHDFYQERKAQDNEERSAAMAMEVLDRLSPFNIRIRSEFAVLVKSLILATKTHTSDETIDHKYMCDIDLAVFGQSEEDFAESNRGIDFEYSWVPEKIYRVKRAEILQSFYDRDPLYKSDYFRLHYEDAAKNNLGREIAKLKSQSC